MNSRRVPHAYVFHGPEGVGKKTLAMRFARLLLCAKPVPIVPPDELTGPEQIEWRDACGRCEECAMTAAGTHPDMHVVYKELNRYHPAPEVRARKAIDLGVDVVRHFIIERVGDRPARGRARVFVVLDGDQMSIAAQNALLKTIEEPPGTAFIILVSRSLERLLPTTQSRCQTVPFRALPTDFVAEQLRTLRPDLPPEPRHFLARYGDGRLGVALAQADAGLFEIKVRLNSIANTMGELGPIEFAVRVQQCAAALADRYVERMVESGLVDKSTEASTTEPTRRGLIESLAVLSWLYRDALRVACGRGDDVANLDQMDVVRSLSARVDLETAAEAIREIHRAGTNITNNANVALTLEALAIRLLRLERRADTLREFQPARGDGP